MRRDLILLILMLGIASISNLCEASKYVIQPNVRGNWFQASQICHANGMKLASIESQADHDQLVKEIKDSGYATSDQFWTSGTRLGREDGKFFWMESGRLLNFSKWRPGEPNNRNEIDVCIFVDAHNGWTDHGCKSKFGVICEYWF